MAKKLSAGIVLYRRRETGLEVLILHPGGPFWAKKDDGAWSIPKGEYLEGEDAFSVAKREFFEETGSELNGRGVELTPAKQPSGKIIRAWAVEGDIDAASIHSNSFPWNGRPSRAVRKSFRKSIVPSGASSGWREQNCSQGNGPCSMSSSSGSPRPNGLRSSRRTR